MFQTQCTALGPGFTCFFTDGYRVEVGRGRGR